MKLVGYVKRDSIVHRLDPRVKIVVVGVLSLIALMFNHPLIMVTLFTLLVILSLIAKVQREFLTRILPMTPVAVSAFILWTIFFKFSDPKVGEGTLFHYWLITIDRLSLMYAIAMSFRVLTILGVPILFFTTTTFNALSLALVKLKVKYIIAFTVALSLRFIDYGLEEMNTIKEAQVSRGLKLRTKTMIERPQNIISLLKPLMERFIRFQEYLAISMDLRAFGAMPTRTFYLEMKMKPLDYLILIATIALFTISVTLRLKGWGNII
ncbi:MAG: energy-coupling factor transporter transmembrane component T family protein [Candidatus Asgardarchaeia archaeon]